MKVNVILGKVVNEEDYQALTFKAQAANNAELTNDPAAPAIGYFNLTITNPPGFVDYQEGDQFEVTIKKVKA